MSNSIPVNTIKRNEYGLIESESINYVYDQNGNIDWRKMIKPEFLVPNKQVFEKRGKPVPKTIEGLEDKELLILLQGIKELAQARGYTKVQHTVTSPSNDYVVSVCSIDWIPNFETEGRSITFSAIGDASPFNTTSFGKNYLAPIAENRAFVRAVRNFLRINIVSQEEIGPSDKEQQEPSNTPSSLLKEVMSLNNVSFEKLKDVLEKEKYENYEKITCLEDIPKVKQFELIERIKKAALKKIQIS